MITDGYNVRDDPTYAQCVDYARHCMAPPFAVARKWLVDPKTVPELYAMACMLDRTTIERFWKWSLRAGLREREVGDDE